MAELPSVDAFVGSDVTQNDFKEAQTQLINFVGELAVKTDAAVAGHKGYATLALAQAAQATLPVNTIVEVMNDPTESNNGMYQWNGTTLSKSSYDPLTQAKVDATTKANAAIATAAADATTKANAAEANAKDYSDSIVVKLEYLYTGNNLVGVKSKSLDGLVYSDSKFTNLYSGKSAIIPVKAGETIYMHNSRQTMTAGSGFYYGFYANTPAVGDTRITNTATTMTDTTSGLSYIRATVPEGAKYLVMNTKFNANTAQWNANYTGFVNSFADGTPVITKINESTVLTEEEYLGIGIESKLIGSAYDSLVFRANSYISSNFLQSGQSGWTTAVMPMDSGREYYAKIDSTTFPFGIGTYNGSVSQALTAAIPYSLLPVTYTLIDEVNKIYKLTPAVGFTGGVLLITTKVTSGGYNHDISETLKVWVDYVSSATTKKEVFSKLDGKDLIDLELRKKFGVVARNNELLTSLHSLKKSIYCFGDSITEGTQGGYTKYLRMGLDATIQNYGSSGANTNRLYGIVLGKKSRNSYDGTTVYPEKDYALADVVTIMIGTNDFDYGDAYWDSLSTIPADNVYAHVGDNTTDAYFESFPANFAGNVGACIEYIRWKNPKCKIYLIAPPQQPGVPTMLSRVPYIKAVADYYAIQFINGTAENGLCLKDISVWSYDNRHLNTLGNEIFGKYLAKKIASS